MGNENTAWMTGTVLTELEPGPLPIIPRTLWGEIEEWTLAWRHADALREEGLTSPAGLLLYGPTGTGKTSLARAILSYMPERPGAIMEAHNITSFHFGESEKNVARGIELAESQNALLVIEEIDALGMKRGAGTMNHEATIRITIALMRCLEAAKIPVIATTNCRENLDPALLRRFELQIEVPPLDEKGRAHVLRKILGQDAPAELIALPLNESIRIAQRMRRRAFLLKCEEAAK